jgi:hypothetical protein
MGATSSQGWYLFIFIVGFTLGPAGLAGLGWPVALVGFAMMVGSLIGFTTLKESATHGSTVQDHNSSLSVARASERHVEGR